MEIGRTLREARLKQGIDIGDVEAQTKIRAKFLRALENEEWGLVGNDTYVKVFLRTYAENLELDPVPLLEEYVISCQVPSTQTRSTDATRRRRFSAARARASLLGGGVIVIVLLVLLLTRSG